MIIRVTDPSVVVLMGASGAGKSTFARTHFKPTEVLSSDFFRGLVSDDENSQSSSAAAFDVLYYVAKKRLEAYKLVVIDATNTDAAQRAVALKLARELHVLATAIVLDLPVEVCRAHNAARPDRQFGDHVLRRHVGAIRRSLRTLRSEGFRQYYVLSSPEEVAAATVERQRLWNDKREERGPFDIIGDVHGCYQELRALLMELGWAVSGTREQPEVVAPPGRRAIFLGDLVDRGPDSPGVLRLVMHMHAQGLALVIPGNHEVKLKKALDGAAVRPTHGLAETLAQLAAEPDVEALKARVSRWIDGLVSHYVLDEGRLVVAHAGLSEELQGRASARVREFALYGDTTGETDEFGLPVRYPWAREYRGRAAVVYGHTPVPEAEWLNGTLCLDTGCVFGGKLTALRWPEKVLVEVPAERTYYEPHRPLPTVGAAREAVALDINDVRGRRYVETRLGPPVAVRPENAAAALEVMARFTVDPRWLVYLPPTMSPPRAAPAGEPLLERPEEALAYYAEEGVAELVCEEKHMGSRAVVVLCRDESVAARRFGIAGHGRGVIYTRTGRPFFTDEALERELLARIDTAMEAAGLWTELIAGARHPGEETVAVHHAKGLQRAQERACGGRGRAVEAQRRGQRERGRDDVGGDHRRADPRAGARRRRRRGRGARGCRGRPLAHPAPWPQSPPHVVVEERDDEREREQVEEAVVAGQSDEELVSPDGPGRDPPRAPRKECEQREDELGHEGGRGGQREQVARELMRPPADPRRQRLRLEVVA
jgi:protein phosphatase